MGIELFFTIFNYILEALSSLEIPAIFGGFSLENILFKSDVVFMKNRKPAWHISDYFWRHLQMNGNYRSLTQIMFSTRRRHRCRFINSISFIKVVKEGAFTSNVVCFSKREQKGKVKSKNSYGKSLFEKLKLTVLPLVQLKIANI